MDLPIVQEETTSMSDTLDNNNNLNLLTSENTQDTNMENNVETQPINEQHYCVTDNDIELLQRQIEVDVDKAKELLLKHNGDQVEALMELYNTNYQPPPSMGLGSSSTKTVELNGVLNDYKNNTQEANIKYPVIENVLNDNPEFVDKFKSAYTYMFSPLILNNNGLTKFKKYGTLLDVINDKVLPIMTENYPIPENLNKDKVKNWRKRKSMLKQIIDKKGKEQNLEQLINIHNYLRVESIINNWEKSEMDIHPLQGNTKELLDKWDMNQAGLVVFKKQIKDRENFLKLYPNYEYLINNNATELAHQNEIINNNQIIVGHTVIINPCY